jgi:ribonuclease HI
MNRKLKEFEERFEISGIRANITGRKTYCASSGYRLMFPKDEGKSYFSFASPKSITKADYMLKVATIRQPRVGNLLDVYEQDIVDYSKEDASSRSLGVIIYDKEKFMIAIKDVKTNETSPFYQVKIFNVFGSIYDIPEVLDMDLAAAYEHLEMTYIKEEKNKKEVTLPLTVSAVLNKPAVGSDSIPHLPVADVYVDIFSLGKKAYWSYRIYQGDYEKKDAKPFKTPGMRSGDYHVSAAIIALSNVTGPCAIRLHSNSNILSKLLECNDLTQPEQKGLKNAGGNMLSNMDSLQQLNKIIKSAGITIISISEHIVPA